MFNVTIINAKKSLSKMAVILTLIILLFLITKLITNAKTSEIMQVNLSEKLVECINSEIPAISSTLKKSSTEIKDEHEESENNFYEMILGIELAKVKESEKIMVDNKDEQNIEQSKEENKQTENTEPINTDISTNAETQVVTQNPISESFNVQINGVKIKNETSFEIDNSIMDTQLEINKENIIIFHTHTCESYTPSEQYPYEQTGNFRTTDLNYSVSRVGDELTNYLVGFGFNVFHDKTYHDYPAYTGSYNRSLKTVENALKSNPSDIIIDLHRDAIGSKSNYDPSVKIGEDVAAQVMFVMGTNGGGLYHPNWKQNLKFAIEVQQKANEMYPGLFKPIILRNSRYNQHEGKAACIIEVGATGNTLEQCLNSMKYVSKVFDEVLRKP